ncbi:ASCH domain-containing protein [Streptococcus mitis]|uniref:ASCH domain-containing protein n=1 Tax=Streptococcus mitis TaxID=28037 RepID=UPI001C4F1344|nr:ASCH domain-containing protein [Streptococcus phage MismyG]
MEAVISIKPEFVKEIVSGRKRFEYRKSFLKDIPEKCYIYSTLPVGKIVGFFTIKQVLRDEPEEIWKLTKEKSGVTKDFFDRYYFGRNKAVAIKIESVNIFEKPKDYKEIDLSGKIPQTYKTL